MKQRNLLIEWSDTLLRERAGMGLQEWLQATSHHSLRGLEPVFTAATGLPSPTYFTFRKWRALFDIESPEVSS